VCRRYRREGKKAITANHLDSVLGEKLGSRHGELEKAATAAATSGELKVQRQEENIGGGGVFRVSIVCLLPLANMSSGDEVSLSTGADCDQSDHYAPVRYPGSPCVRTACRRC
jgi:hypothetical protein